MSGGGAPPPPESFKVPYQKEAAQSTFDAIGGLEAMPNYGQDVYTAAAGSTLPIVGANTGYNPAQTVDYGNSISALPQEYLPYAQDLFSQGFDVNNEVYGRAAHNLSQQVRAASAQRGLATDPFGAGLEADAMRDFNLDWENEQLSRMATAMGAALPAYQLGGQQMGYGQTVAQSGPAFQADLASSLSPVAMGAYYQPQQAIGSWLNYMGAGTSADSVAAQNYASQIEAYKAEQAAEAAMYSAIGELAGSATGAAIGQWG